MPIEEYNKFKKEHPDCDFEVVVMTPNSNIPTTLLFDGNKFRTHITERPVSYWCELPKPPKFSETDVELAKIGKQMGGEYIYEESNRTKVLSDDGDLIAIFYKAFKSVKWGEKYFLDDIINECE